MSDLTDEEIEATRQYYQELYVKENNYGNRNKNKHIKTQPKKNRTNRQRKETNFDIE